MRTHATMLGMILVAGLMLGGGRCGRQAEQASDSGTAWPLDSLAYVYADPIAVSPINDHPFRWIGFALNPVGVAVDRLVNRPIYNGASTAPVIFGYTPEDATLNAQRPSGAYR